MLWGETPWDEALGAVLDGDGHAAPDDIDLARVHETGELVYLGASAGLVAQTLVTARSSTATGRARYASALAETAQTFAPYPGRVTVDGRVVHEGPTVVANVGGGRHRGGQYLLLPHSELDDGLLDVCVIGSPVAPVAVPGAMRHGDHLGLDGVVYERGRQVRVERLDGGALVFECDGELHDDVVPGMTLDVLPHALPVWRRLAAPLAR
jgi:diacylglycerol kinase (ATP)